MRSKNRPRTGTVCNCCGRTYRCVDTDICITCHEAMCPDCFREYSGECCFNLPELHDALERSVIRVIQSAYACKQLKEKREAAEAVGGE